VVAEPLVSHLKETYPPVPAAKKKPHDAYGADSIKVLEGLEAVRKRPGMYIGSTGERGLHHLVWEVVDNAVDEAMAGYATQVDVRMLEDGGVEVTDDGRGIPVAMHSSGQPTIDVVMTVLHAGGKFDSKAYETSGGLHGVGVSVVNALSEHVEVEVAKEQQLYRMRFSRGVPLGPLEHLGAIRNRRGTKVRFRPDPEIFKAGSTFSPARLFRMARSKAYLFRGVEIRWTCAADRITDQTPAEATFHFPNGLADALSERIGDLETVTPAF